MRKISWKRTVAVAAGCVVVMAALAPAGHRRRRCCRCHSPVVDSGLSPFMGPANAYGDPPGAPQLAGPALPPVSPPPGTLGQTYLRQTRPVPAAKHPRAGLVDVRAPGASSVSVQWTNPFKLEDELNGFVDAREEALWHFESPQLIPGVPQVYRVEARYGTGEEVEVREKYVRLIMGRTVNVRF